MRWICAVMAIVGVVSSAGAQDFDPAALKTRIAGKPSEVLVLATPHLSQLPTTFAAANLGPLLDRLAAWKPDLITIESLGGPQCEYLRRYAALHVGAAEDYCWNPASAGAATGLDVAAATLEAQRLLAAWPAAPSAAQRRHLAAVFLAGGDRSSALVQWLRLAPGERRAGDGIDAPLSALLGELAVKPNENYQIAAVLAARLGLERVYSTDDHTADDASGGDADYGAAMQRIWSGPAGEPRRKNEAALNADIGTAEGLMALYRAYNAPGMAKMVFDSDFGAALADDTPQLYGRRYVGWWETRNLRMVGNIRSVLAARPGARLLTIVGGSHKGYFQAYLRPMHDIRIVDAAAVLR